MNVAMNVVNVRQGTPEWLALRARHFTASELPAAAGVSPYTTRTALLRQKTTGITPEVDAHKQSLFDAGHAAEDGARLIAQEILNDDLYPITATALIDGVPMLASLDGATLTRGVIWEHKLYSDDLADQVRRGVIRPDHRLQMLQQLLVTGARSCLFMVSDGTRERAAWTVFEPSRDEVESIVPIWKQFVADLEAGAPGDAPTPAAVAAPQEHLPAVSVQINGALSVISNLAPFGEKLRAYISRIPAAPSTDQEFADTEAACKRLKEAEDRLQAAEDGALASMADVNEMRRMVGEFRELARTTRLASEKLVTARKAQIREDEVRRGASELAKHTSALNARLGAGYISIVGNFAAAIKGLKTLDSVRNAVDTELARAKIEASAAADKIDANLQAMSSGSGGFCGLFPDMKALALKEPDDLVAVIAQRVAARKASLGADRARIAAEEAARIERESAAKAKLLEEPVSQQVLKAEGAIPDATARETPATASPRGGAMGAGQPAAAGPIDEAPTMPLGAINDRLGFTVSADFLATLGFQFAQSRTSKLYKPSDLRGICAAIARHCERLGAKP